MEKRSASCLPGCLLLLLLVTTPWTAQAQNPGLRIRVHQRGLDYAVEVAKTALAERMRTLTVPTQSGSPSGMQYTIRNLRVSRLATPTASLTLLPGSGLRMAVTIPDLEVSADFNAGKKIWFFWVRTSGSVTATASGVSMDLSTNWGMDGSGRPTMSVSGCSERLGDLRLRVSGTGLDWLFNLLLGLFKGTIRGLVEKQMCKLATDAINQQSKSLAASIPMQIPFMKTFELDYRLLSPPAFASSHLETNHKGVVYWSGDRRDPPFPAPPLPASASTSRMVTLWLSEHLINSMAHAAHVHNYIRFGSSDLPAQSAQFLQTSCPSSSFCLGTLLPKVAEQFPNAQASVQLSSSQAPSLAVSRGHANLQVQGGLDLSVGSTSLLSLGLDVALNFSASIANNRVVVKIAHVDPKVTVKSSIATLPADKLKETVEVILSRYLVPHLNGVAAAGVPLPLTQEIQVTNPQLVFEENALMVASDVRYQP